MIDLSTCTVQHCSDFFCLLRASQQIPRPLGASSSLKLPFSTICPAFKTTISSTLPRVLSRWEITSTGNARTIQGVQRTPLPQVSASTSSARRGFHPGSEAGASRPGIARAMAKTLPFVRPEKENSCPVRATRVSYPSEKPHNRLGACCAFLAASIISTHRWLLDAQTSIIFHGWLALKENRVL